MPWAGFIEKRHARNDLYERMARLANEFPWLSREARLLMTGQTDRMAHAMLDATDVFVEVLSEAGRKDLLEKVVDQAENLPGTKAL